MEELLMENVLAALGRAFPEAMIVTERVRQGFAAPAFLLRAVKTAVRKEMGDRYRGEAEFSLRYFPEKEDAVAAAGIPGKVEAEMKACPGFLRMESKAGEDGTLTMRAFFSAVGFQVEEAGALMEKMGMRLTFGAAASEKTGG